MTFVLEVNLDKYDQEPKEILPRLLRAIAHRIEEHDDPCLEGRSAQGGILWETVITDEEEVLDGRL